MGMFKLKKKEVTSFKREGVCFIHDAVTGELINTLRASEVDGIVAKAFYLIKNTAGKWETVEKTNDPAKAEKWLSDGNGTQGIRVYQ